MSNTLIIDSLNTLFSMSNTAVIGAQEQFVAFMNPAAQELFRGNRTNHKLTELLPAHITEATATEFVTSATIEKRHVIISVTSFGAFRLFSFVPQDENALRAGAQFAPFLASLNAFRTLTTYFSDYAMQLSDVRFRRNAAELTQFYYRLLRFTLNASTASGLYDGTLAFMPQLCDLGKECRTLLDNIQPITDANQKIGYKIRAAQQVDRVPYMLVLGAKEAEAGNISVRDRSNETVQMSVDEFVAKVLEEIKTRA